MKKVLYAVVLGAVVLAGAGASAAGIGPVLTGALPGPLPLFPADNWWNTDVSAAPLDPNSSSFISFIGTTRALHPDLGGDVASDGSSTYGIPYCVVDGTQAKKTVLFQYFDESDGVDHTTQTSYPFYPIPDEAWQQNRWVEGGPAGSVDLRTKEDRHILIVDRDSKYLYELYNVWYDSAHSQWYAGSGAFFDMSTNNRRPDGWTSADAAGLAILPGLVRYDETYDPSVTEIGHAFRVTVRATNGYVYPASHVAGSTSGALPMGARLRLKATKDISGFSPEVQKIFRAMKRYGLIVADNGSDMYITGTYDARWVNGGLNSAFGALTANDFEVVQLGWQPPSGPPALASVSVSPSSVVGGQQNATGTASLTTPAPPGGAVVSLASDSAAASVPASVTIGQGVTSMTFTVTTTAVPSSTLATITGTYSGVSKTAALTVTAPAPATLSSLTLNPTSVRGGTTSTGTVTLSANAPNGGAVVALSSSKTTVATVPASVTVAAGTKTASFTVTTNGVKTNTSVVISASYAGVAKSATLSVKKR